MDYSCIKCNSQPVAEEYQRCAPCQKEHAELAAKLDARPRQKVEKVREELFAIKSIKRGVEFTDLITRQDAMALGINLEGKTPITQ